MAHSSSHHVRQDEIPDQDQRDCDRSSHADQQRNGARNSPRRVRPHRRLDQRARRIINQALQLLCRLLRFSCPTAPPHDSHDSLNLCICQESATESYRRETSSATWRLHTSHWCWLRPRTRRRVQPVGFQDEPPGASRLSDDGISEETNATKGEPRRVPRELLYTQLPRRRLARGHSSPSPHARPKARATQPPRQPTPNTRPRTRPYSPTPTSRTARPKPPVHGKASRRRPQPPLAPGSGPTMSPGQHSERAIQRAPEGASRRRHAQTRRFQRE